MKIFKFFLVDYQAVTRQAKKSPEKSPIFSEFFGVFRKKPIQKFHDGSTDRSVSCAALPSQVASLMRYSLQFQ